MVKYTQKKGAYQLETIKDEELELLVKLFVIIRASDRDTQR